ncbi:hypothetical protein LTR99_001991 [Exophiala xenobiotica]|uniref:DUF3752 domain-containing protein n=1 Tax=Vermiconidia calcicola TaxID=1690605 RepID=A0AAV9QL39_9PEZI|nr:hypothetical protein LTR92_004409 [Exophiala xenobiotica]KAK5529278.1 hypothetical protein LTR23_010795 [Chaetothyriales sp. CCFEE 6169]KAK5542670.1 hypothetical protein LTR25_002557 [Vermiconidia calcicola]KAK5211907.1 hypothetical protein LTR41_002149 [Exophiala xenobiotica]KAK5226230.1 hypothetical protein LTR72_004135 [Exophiala xenobiotica]
MPSVGPQLPPELQKRKRSADEDDEEGSSSDSSTGPLPLRPGSRAQSPSSPKRSRVLGPTLPPAPLDERPSSPPQPESDNGSESSDDDDFGPSLPSANDGPSAKSSSSIGPQIPTPSAPPTRLQRDEWMTIAPTNGDWSSRVDPTKLKNRKFNTGRGAKAPPQKSGAGGESWHETPEQKQARLKREVMGITDPTGSSDLKSKNVSSAHEEATAQRLREYSEKQRGPSLYSSHNSSTKPIEEDDPSARAFDREKDIAGGATINATKRREMVKKASDFSSRFSEARYL